MLTWVLFGAIMGIIANIFDSKGHTKAGIFSSIFLGILGALSGGFLSSAIFGANFNSVSVPAISLAFISSILLVFVGRYLID
jgi:uncharacterized membrane protein YeaQ/YmgE (transglycosylase-associated protein family)